MVALQFHVFINAYIIRYRSHLFKVFCSGIDAAKSTGEEEEEDEANKSINILKALTSTTFGKQKETIITTYKTVVQSKIEYANTIWSSTASKTNLNKLQIIQNSALRIATGCTKDTSIQHLHQESEILPLEAHLKLHANQLQLKSQNEFHPLHSLSVNTPQIINNISKKKKKRFTVFNDNKNYQASKSSSEDSIKTKMQIAHTEAVQDYLDQLDDNQILGHVAPKVNKEEVNLSRKTRRTLAQLRTGKSPFLYNYKHKIDKNNYPSSLCPLCKNSEHDIAHLFQCSKLPTTLGPIDLWNNPVRTAALLEAWELRIGLERH